MIDWYKNEIIYWGKKYYILSYFGWKRSSEHTNICASYLVKTQDNKMLYLFQEDKNLYNFRIYDFSLYDDDLHNVRNKCGSLVLIKDNTKIVEDDIILI